MEGSLSVSNIAQNQIANTISLSNESHDSVFIRKFYSSSLNLTDGYPQQEINFRVIIPQGCNSPMDQWQTKARLTYDNATALGVGLALPVIESIFARTKMSCQGVLIKDVSYFTQTNRVSNRMSYSHTRNVRNLEYTNVSTMESKAYPDLDGALYREEAIPTLAPFSLNTQEAVAPPGTVWDISYVLEGTKAAALAKMAEGFTSASVAGVTPTLVISDIWIEVPFYRMTADLDESYALKFVEPNLYPTAITSTSMEIVNDIGVCTPIFVGCFMQSSRVGSPLTAYADADIFIVPATRFITTSVADYKTLCPLEVKGVPASGNIDTLQFFVGAHSIPQYVASTIYSNKSLHQLTMNYGYKTTPHDMLGESYTEWYSVNGPLIVVPVVLSEEQEISRIMTSVTFKTAIPYSTNLFTVVGKQRILKIDYDTSTGAVVNAEISP